jgi:hypothetical protein
MSKDLIVLTADRQQELTIKTLLDERYHSLGIRQIEYDIFRHPRKDPGVFHEAADFLAAYCPPQYQHALVLLDHAWDGAPDDPDLMRQQLNDALMPRWDEDRFEIIVIVPELETWVWSQSPHVAEILRTSWENIRALAETSGYWTQEQAKPADPKRLLEDILAQQRRPRSSAIFQALARQVGLAGCIDPAFTRMREALTRWFSASVY